MGKAGSEGVGLQESLTIGKKSLIGWRFLRRKKVRISIHKSLSAILFRDLTLDQRGNGEDVDLLICI